MKTSKNKIFFFPIESVAREFDYKLRISKILNKNSIVYFGHPFILNHSLKLISKINYFGQNIFDKYKNNNFVSYKALKKNGGRLFYIDEEGGVYPKKNAEEIFKKRNIKKRFEKNDNIFLWGKKQSQLMNTVGKIHVLGHPRFYTFNNQKKTKSSKENFILINTNFSLLNSSSSLDHRQKSFNSESVFLDFYQQQLLDFYNLIDLIKKNPGKNYVIRTHPSESEEVYKTLLKNYDNITIRSDRNLHDEIENCRELIHFDCTTALDALPHNKKITNLSLNETTVIDGIENKESEWFLFEDKTDSIASILNEESVLSSASTFVVGLIIKIISLLYPIVFRIKYSYKYDRKKTGVIPQDKNLKKISKYVYSYYKI